MTAAWVVGGHGLLGTALRHELERNGYNVFTPSGRFQWRNQQILNEQIAEAVKAFAVFTRQENSWQVYWAAGVGTMSSVSAELAMETHVLSKLLSLVATEPVLMAKAGSLSFASSAGAIYAGATDDMITENTVDAPTTDYAREKIKQEHIVSEFVANYSRGSALIARISTLYGSGQATGKQQGLITEIARRIIRGQSIQIYVPFDTIRDYITAADAAAIMVAATSAVGDKFSVFTKIVASEQPITIAEIISVFKRITRRTLRVVTSANKMTSLYNRRVQFKSISVPISRKILKTTLLIGIAQILAEERAKFAQPKVFHKGIF